MSKPTAKVIAHSISSVTGQELITFELEFWRGVLAEFNTHNALSKNTSSSRAIPVPSMNENILADIGMPYRFGKQNTGMQDLGEHDAPVIVGGIEMSAKEAWTAAVKTMVMFSEAFHEAKYAKQICNRLTEIGQTCKVVMTATDLDNFYWLRDHYMADPTIEALAKAIKAAHEASTPTELDPGEWHVPYYNDGIWKPYKTLEIHPVTVVDVFGHSLEHALTISASCCAQVSFRSLNDTIEKARKVVEKLNLNGEEPGQPVHASPVEHQGSPIAKHEHYVQQTSISDNEPFCININDPQHPETWQKGITHVTRNGVFGSGNLKGFIQCRQLIPGNTYTGGAKNE